MSTALSAGRERAAVGLTVPIGDRLRALDDRVFGTRRVPILAVRYYAVLALWLIANLRLVFAFASVDTASFVLLGYVLTIIPTVLFSLRRRNLQREAARD